MDQNNYDSNNNVSNYNFRINGGAVKVFVFLLHVASLVFKFLGLRKAKEYDWKDSNMALFGSDVEKNIKSKWCCGCYKYKYN